MKDQNSCIARRLRTARLTLGVSQQKLGILASIDERSASARMNQYERGSHIPNFLTLQHIGKVLGYPLAFFVSDDDFMAELVCLLARLSEADKLHLLNVAKGLGSHLNRTAMEDKSD